MDLHARKNHPEGEGPVVVLLVGGLDPTGEAGVVADLEVLFAYQIPSRTALSAVTVQDQERYLGHHAVPGAILRDTLEAAARGVRLGAVKVGMVPGTAQARAIGAFLEGLGPGVSVVVDPVLESSSGGALMAPEAIETYRREVLSRATLITPNLPEAERLYGAMPATPEAMETEAQRIARASGAAVLLKGGHLHGRPVDVLADGKETLRFEAERRLPDRRGTGCRLATAIALHLARGRPLAQAVRLGRGYVERYLEP